jgi:hypothetical protein
MDLSCQAEEEDSSPSTSSFVDEYINETAKLLISGGFAGAVSKTATAPLARYVA